ncbi:hypothetical protein M3P05_10100 [Sansalvadorimonas sp. 2012CJ34-2]|uniref:Uncharacterized protein n=1 Tax=Parendozoicomonas callyspongiae TaxID=2942213 RepID=A0ABT0PFW5_9GAMM|nr:hypothetical protein [Sansalvadorimonas sp. 2012CJ34-2]MCL6270273.1 hypothetical protein [Sansalvadorimonas sp. 2012CJ34-2]
MIFVGAFVLGTVTMLLLVANAVCFYRKNYHKLSQAIDGEVFDAGFLFAASRFMLWGHYCLFPNRAKRSNVQDIFASLPTLARYQLIFHWFGILFVSAIMFIGGAYSL